MIAIAMIHAHSMRKFSLPMNVHPYYETSADSSKRLGELDTLLRTRFVFNNAPPGTHCPSD